MSSLRLLSIGIAVIAGMKTPAFASPNSLRELLTVKSVVDFEAKRSEQARDLDARRSCYAQLKAKAVPRDCFVVVTDDPHEVDRLSKVCIANARSSRSRLDLAQSSKDIVLPTRCLKAINERLDDLRYVDESLKPELSVVRTGGLVFEE